MTEGMRRRAVAGLRGGGYGSGMTLEELADLIRANSANTNGRIESLRNETNAQLMNIQNDLTDVRRSLDLVATVSDLQKQVDALAAEVADLKRRA